MKVVFYNRDFTSQVPLSHLKITVERYSHSMIGGPDTAYIKIETSGDNWELTKLLRAPVEIYDGDGHLNWWGYVNRMTVPNGEIMVGMGLDNMFNYVAANYSLLDDGSSSATSQVVTSWASDAASILEYGQKEKLLTINNATAAQAEGARDTYLAGYKYAPPEIELSGGNTNHIRIECYGWFKTLEWKYYANATTSNLATTAQIRAIVTSAGQFFRGTLIENASGISSNQYRDGTQNALTQISELLNAGTTAIKPLLARVDKDRYLHVYQRQAESPEYLMRNDGNLETLLGQTVKPSHCVNAAWVRIRDIPDILGGLSAMRNFFIESAEYNAEQDKTIYRPAGAFEPVRLAKWFGVDKTNNLGSGGSSNFGSITPYHTHPTSGGSSSFAQLSISTSTNTVNSITEAIDADGIVSVSSPNIRIALPGTYLFGLKTNLTITCTGSQYGGIDIYDATLSLTPGDSTVASAYHATAGSLSSKLVRIGSCVVATIPSANFDLTVQAIASATTFAGSSTFSILKLS